MNQLVNVPLVNDKEHTHYHRGPVTACVVYHQGAT